jgi:hypothetical protein
MSVPNNSYVYAHYKPDYNIFYIGKGHGRRAWRTSGRGEFWDRTIRKHGGYHIVLLHEHLTEDEAFQKEKEEIEFWGRRNDGGFLINLTDGGDGVSGYKFTKEQLANVKAAKQKLAQDPEWRAKQKAGAQKLAQDPEWRAKNKAGVQKRSQDPEWRAKQKAAMQKLAQDPEWRAAMQKLAQDPEWRAKNKAAMQKLAQDPEWRAKQKAGAQKLAQDPIWLAKVKAGAQKRSQDPEWRAKQKAASVPRQIEFSVISPDGTLYLTQRNVNEFCKTHGLQESCMRKVLKGKRNHHLGWKKYIPPINNHLLNQFI